MVCEYCLKSAESSRPLPRQTTKPHGWQVPPGHLVGVGAYRM